MHPSKFSQVFNCFAYLAIVTWPEVCCASKTSYWRPGGQINWAHHLELLAASSCLVFHQCWVLFCTYFRTPKRAVMARGRPGIPMDRVTTAAFHLQLASHWSRWVYATDASGGSTWGLWSYAFACVILWMLRRQAAVRSGGGFLRKSLSALERISVRSKMSGKCQKRFDLESRTYTNRIMLLCIPPLLVTCRRVFSQCLMNASVFDNVPSTILQPKSAWCVLFGCVWRKPLEILRREGRAYVIGTASCYVGLLNSCGNGCCSCWTTWPWYWVLQMAAVAFQISTTLVAKSVSSLLQC